MNNQMSSQSSDQVFLNDSLATQKQISSNYNTFASECVNVNLRNEFLNILREEHDIQTDFFNELTRRGWYQTTPAEAQKVNEARTKFSSQNSQTNQTSSMS